MGINKKKMVGWGLVGVGGLMVWENVVEPFAEDYNDSAQVAFAARLEDTMQTITFQGQGFDTNTFRLDVTKLTLGNGTPENAQETVLDAMDKNVDDDPRIDAVAACAVNAATYSLPEGAAEAFKAGRYEQSESLCLEGLRVLITTKSIDAVYAPDGLPPTK